MIWAVKLPDEPYTTLRSGLPVALKAVLISAKASFILAATATEATCPNDAGRYDSRNVRNRYLMYFIEIKCPSIISNSL
jgi:hypothetical protein